MLSRLPHEVRLKIFHLVFAQSGCREVIRVEDTAEGITYKFTDKNHERDYSGAVSCLDAAVVGSGVAAAAAEAFYQSKIMFGVDAKVLCTFLQSCPFSLVVEPGKYIKTLLLYMDEDPKFIGDRVDGQALRKADWVDLVSDAGNDRTTRSGDRTQLMRQCWRAILNMPKLIRFEFCIMPSRGKASAYDIQRWEIRDIIPTHFRLFCKHVDTSVYFRTWELYQEPTSNAFEKWYYQTMHDNVDDDGFYSSHFDLSACIPYRWREPTHQERVQADDMLARQDRGTLAPKDHAVRNYDALHELLHRLYADKSTFMIHLFCAEMFANPT